MLMSFVSIYLYRALLVTKAGIEILRVREKRGADRMKER